VRESQVSWAGGTNESRNKPPSKRIIIIIIIRGNKQFNNHSFVVVQLDIYKYEEGGEVLPSTKAFWVSFIPLSSTKTR